MRCCHRRVAVVVALVGSATLAGCSAGPEGEPTTSSLSATSATSATTTETHTPAPGAIEVSPGGVTTAVGAPANSTEEEYFQACKAARDWMDQQDGDPHTLIEPYLESVQAPDSAGPGTFGTPWSQLPPDRQAAVIVAVHAAADAACG